MKLRRQLRVQSGMQGNEYAGGMIEMDMNVGKLPKALDDAGIADNTIVVFTTDNGPNQFTWPDAAPGSFFFHAHDDRSLGLDLCDMESAEY
jgi:arylsulfatase